MSSPRGWGQQWISKKKKYLVSRIDLLKIVDIREKSPWMKKLDSISFYLSVQIGTSNNSNIVFKFDHKIKRDLFWQGLQYFYLMAIKSQQMYTLRRFSVFWRTSAP